MARPKVHVYPVITCPDGNELFALLAEHKKVEIANLGTFELVKIPRKIIYHNFSKRKRVIKPYVKLKFTQSASIKKLLIA